MKQAGELLFTLVSGLLFCMAVTLLFLYARTLMNSYQLVKQAVVNSEILYETDKIAESKFSYAAGNIAAANKFLTKIDNNQENYKNVNGAEIGLRKESFGNEIEEIRREELVIMLVSGLAYDITVDGKKLDRDSFDYETFDFASLAQTYQRQYQYNTEGRISRIIYSRREK